MSVAKSLEVCERAPPHRSIGQTKRQGRDWSARTNFVSRRRALIYGVVTMLFVASAAMANGVGSGAKRGLNWQLKSRVSDLPSIGHQYLCVRETIKGDLTNDKLDGSERNF